MIFLSFFFPLCTFFSNFCKNTLPVSLPVSLAFLHIYSHHSFSFSSSSSLAFTTLLIMASDFLFSLSRSRTHRQKGEVSLSAYIYLACACVYVCVFSKVLSKIARRKKRNGCPRISLRYIFFRFSLYVYNANTNLIISYRTRYSVSLKRTSILFSALRSASRGLRFNSTKNAWTCIKKRTPEIIETGRFPFRVRLCALEKCIQIVYVAFTHVSLFYFFFSLPSLFHVIIIIIILII